MKLSARFILTTSALTMLCLSGCDNYTLAGKWRYTEVRRIESPDSLVDAVVMLGNSGATSPGTTLVYLVPAGQHVRDPRKEEPVFEAERLKGFKVEWKGARLLEIHYAEAMISKFANYWYSARLKNYRHAIELRLEPALSGTSSLPEDLRNWANQ